MVLRVDGDHYSIECRGAVVIIELRNSAITPVFDFRAMDQLLDAVKQFVTDNELASTGWHALYDLSKLNNFNIAVWPIIANFARWTDNNGRKRLAHIFPEKRSASQMKRLKRVIAGLIAANGIKVEELYTASTVEDGVRWLTTPTEISGSTIS